MVRKDHERDSPLIPLDLGLDIFSRDIHCSIPGGSHFSVIVRSSSPGLTAFALLRAFSLIAQDSRQLFDLRLHMIASA
jgi:hypothetical protein